jgi:excisionase family DNA binding protein
MSNPIPVLLTPAEVADALRINVRTLQRLESDGVLIPIRVGRSVRYRSDDVADLLVQRGKASA